MGTSRGVIKSWAIRRLPEGQQWDGEMVRNMVGSPENWKLDASEELQLVELEDKDEPELADLRLPNDDLGYGHVLGHPRHPRKDGPLYLFHRRVSPPTLWQFADTLGMSHVYSGLPNSQDVASYVEDTMSCVNHRRSPYHQV